jgi:hypothetical protein
MSWQSYNVYPSIERLQKADIVAADERGDPG